VRVAPRGKKRKTQRLKRITKVKQGITKVIVLRGGKCVAERMGEVFFVNKHKT